MSEIKSTTHYSTGRIIVLSFLVVISIGTLLLSLPEARTCDIPLIDLFFSATSYTCVTGLSTVPISSYSIFGKCIILALIQIGGLGLMTLSFFLISLFLDMGMATKLMAGRILEFESWSKVRHFLKLVLGFTLFFELTGAFLLYPTFARIFPFKQAAFFSIFHSISAFCNAGVSLFDESVIQLHTHPFALAVLGLLTICGGIGFVVWYEVWHWVRSLAGFKKIRTSLNAFSLNSRLSMITSLILIVGATLLFLLFERHNGALGESWMEKITQALFMGSTIRSAGFFSLPVGSLHAATLFLFQFLMLIGTSPCSTGSGIKTTTFAVLVATIISVLRGREDVEVWGRRIPLEQVYKAISIIVLSLGWIFVSGLILMTTEENIPFQSIVFEVFSAFSTVGLSIGITGLLSTVGKCVIIGCMFIGRIGSLTLILALRSRTKKQTYRYPSERVIIG